MLDCFFLTWITDPVLPATMTMINESRAVMMITHVRASRAGGACHILWCMGQCGVPEGIGKSVDRSRSGILVRAGPQHQAVAVELVGARRTAHQDSRGVGIFLPSPESPTWARGAIGQDVHRQKNPILTDKK